MSLLPPGRSPARGAGKAGHSGPYNSAASLHLCAQVGAAPPARASSNHW